MRSAQPWKTNRSRVLRANETAAEEKLWFELRDRRLMGLKFIRQAPIDRFFVDFLCRDRKVIVKVDGDTHGTEAEIAADALRTTELHQAGFRIFRAWNDDVFENMDGVIDALIVFIEKDDQAEAE